MSVKRIIENLKKYIEGEVKMYNTFGKTHGAKVNQMIDRCYGAVMYSSYLLSSEDCEKVGKWWDDEMLPVLRELN
jgi:hypothetical protein